MREFHSCKSAVPKSNVNTDRIVIFDNFPCTKKWIEYFLGCKNNEDVTPFCLLLLKITEHEILLRIYSEIWSNMDNMSNMVEMDHPGIIKKKIKKNL